MTTGRTITYTDLTTAWGATADGAAYVTRQAPNTKPFMLADLDDQGHVTRTFDQPTGRIDLYTNSASGQSVGPAMVVAFNNAVPADGDNLGHYAYRGNDSNLNLNTFAYLYGKAESVSAAGLNSQIIINVMSNQPAGAGNAQPNYGIVISGKNQNITYPAGMAFAESGLRTVTVAGSPTQTYVNSSTTQTLAISLGAGGVINETGGGGLSLQASNVEGINLSGTLVKLPIQTQIMRSLRTSKTSNYTLLTTDSGTHFDNASAVGEVDFTLPTSPSVGMVYRFTTRAAQTLKVIAPASAFINVAGTQSASAGSTSTATNGCTMELECTNGNLWTANFFTGTWTTA